MGGKEGQTERKAESELGGDKDIVAKETYLSMNLLESHDPSVIREANKAVGPDDEPIEALIKDPISTDLGALG